MLRLGLSGSILLAWVVMTLLGQFLPLDSHSIDLAAILHGPGLDAWLGYDDLGRPVLDRLLEGAATSFLVSVSVVSISLVTGTLVGTISAYYGGWLDMVLVRIIDIFLAFPGILLAIALSGLLQPGIDNVVIALSVVGWVGFARLARAQVLSVKEREHVLAAEALGSRAPVIIVRHLIPMVLAPLIVEATFGIASVVIAEAGLSFLGLGVQPPEASWGSMIRDGARYLLVAPHMVLAPGITMMLVVLAVNLAGDRLRDWLDVKGDRPLRK